MNHDLHVRPVRVDTYVLRQPIAQPVRTSFGTMHERPALLLRIEDADGAHGWGEVWCNFQLAVPSTVRGLSSACLQPC